MSGVFWRFLPWLLSFLVVALALPLGCSDEESSQPVASTGGRGGGGGHGGGGGTLEPVCTDGTRWTMGTQAFREATSDWALDAIGAEGTRLAAVDFDGDGWTDLVVRHANAEPDDFAPDGTRQSWLLRNRGNGTFEDVTQSSGVRQRRVVVAPDLGRPGQVFAFADVDNDGDLDVYTGLNDSPSAPQAETSELMLNQGDGTFALGPADSALRVEEQDVPSGASFVDFDRDGLIDLWVTQGAFDYQPQVDRLYRGDGSGRFVDVTDLHGLTTLPWTSVTTLNQARSHSYAWSALACDLNGDGNLELLAASYGRAPNLLWQASGPEAGYQFANRSVDSGYAFDHRVDWSDNESARCHCQLHPADDDCAGVPPPEHIACNDDGDAFRWDHQYDREPFRLGGNSGSTICGDVDNDGAPDLLTSEIVHWDVGSSSDPSELLFNDGQPEPIFERPGNDVTGLVREHTMVDWNDGDMTGALLDFDNDGWLDVYIGASDYPGNQGLLFHQVAPRQFEAVPFAEGIDHNRSHGIAVADFDRDGDLDVVVGHSLSRCGGENECYPTRQVRYFENLLGQDGNWVQLALSGAEGTNRAAIGARVQITTDDGVTRTQEVGGGHGHYGAQHDLTLHFGLGTACRAQATVRWPDGNLTEQQFEVLSGYRFQVVQGEEPVAVTEL